jgi:competence protein ComEC
MLDVGQGESILLQPPLRQPQRAANAVLFDAGGSPFGGGRFDLGGLVLAPALRALGVTRLDNLLLTHGDPDHIGGAIGLLERIEVARLTFGIIVPGHEPTTRLTMHARANRLPVLPARAGQIWRWGEARIRVLHPAEPDWERRRVRNDDSVVVEVVHGEVAVLLTGDVSAEIERDLLPRLTPARTRILKVAHHGSRTSTSPALVEGWRPQLALISCGRGNAFGHPTMEVLARLAAVGAHVYRTDRDGAVTVESNGHEVAVTTTLRR